MALNILLVGGGGREHALAWKLKRSPELGRLYAAPGNPGIAQEAEIVPLAIDDHQAVVGFCRDQEIGLVVVGPEAPLVAGIVDELLAAGIPAFGPTRAAAQLEGSKGFTKDLCARQGIPTAAYARFDEIGAARAYVEAQGAPIVVKADGLAAGKGVTVAATVNEALEALEACFSEAGAAVVVEECLAGPEASLFCLCDGTNAMPFGTAEDHKRAFDGDEGPNTGGMGAFSPSVVLIPEALERAMAEIVAPTLKGMAEAGTPFRGVLYAGLMLTAEGPKLIEYNVRFGDPEAQVLMMRLQSDLVPLLAAAASGDLSAVEAMWREDSAVTVVLASKGYPGTFETKTPILRLPVATESEDRIVFHAGTAIEDGALVATGGRVLAVTAMAPDLGAAVETAYAEVAVVDWPNGFYRHDIARRALAR